MDTTGWLIAGAIGAGVVAVAGGAWLLERRRRQKLEQVAHTLGLDFQRQSEAAFEMGLGAFDLLQRGRSRRCSNALTGTVEDVGVALFDYQYTTGSGKQQRTHKQTVAAFHISQGGLPAFQLERERLFHKLGQVFGGQDIDFDDYPEFSKRYLLRGPDEQAIRHSFTGDVIRFFERLNEKWNIEAAGDRLIVYHRGKRLKPDRYPEFLQSAWNVLLAFTAG